MILLATLVIANIPVSVVKWFGPKTDGRRPNRGQFG